MKFSDFHKRSKQLIWFGIILYGITVILFGVCLFVSQVYMLLLSAIMGFLACVSIMAGFVHQLFWSQRR